MRTVIVRKRPSVIGAAAAAGPRAMSPAVPAAASPAPLPPRPRPPRTRRRSLHRPDASRVFGARGRRGPLRPAAGFLLGPHLAAGPRHGGRRCKRGMQRRRGPLLRGAHYPGGVLAKLDNEGRQGLDEDVLRRVGAAATDGMAHAIAGMGLDRDGNIYLAGDLNSESGPIDFGCGALASAGGADIFVASFDASGQHRWSKRFGAGQNQHVAALAVDPEGLVALARFARRARTLAVGW